MAEPKMIEVEVAYALPHRQKIYALLVEEGTTALQAVERSTLCADFAGVDLAAAKMGVFGQSIKVPAKHQLQAGDRVEVYRPLIADPKEARRKRAAKRAR
ncbi:MAG: RnfH family protein [Cellvibrionaceae bacterium]|nr:RnfH family protein [Cellvibrionaceae bacterium]